MREQATAVACSTGQACSKPVVLDLPASLVKNKLSAYAVARAVRLAPCQHCATPTSEPADASTPTRRRCSAYLPPRGMVSLGCVRLQSTKPAVVGCRSPLAGEQKERLYVHLGRLARCALRFTNRREIYGHYLTRYGAHPTGREGSGKTVHSSLHSPQKSSRDKLPGS